MSKFKVGDKVEVVYDVQFFNKGDIVLVNGYNEAAGHYLVQKEETHGYLTESEMKGIAMIDKEQTEEEMMAQVVKVNPTLFKLMQECEWDFHQGSRYKKLVDFVQQTRTNALKDSIKALEEKMQSPSINQTHEDYTKGMVRGVVVGHNGCLKQAKANISNLIKE